MIKGILHDDRGPVIIIGLSAGNVARLKENNPIVFSLAALKLVDHQICVTWNNDGRAAIPEGFTGTVLAFSSRSLEKMKTDHEELANGRYRFVVFCRETEADMEHELRKLFPKMITTHEGWSPSAIPDSMN